MVMGLAGVSTSLTGLEVDDIFVTVVRLVAILLHRFRRVSSRRMRRMRKASMIGDLLLKCFFPLLLCLVVVLQPIPILKRLHPIIVGISGRPTKPSKRIIIIPPNQLLHHLRPSNFMPLRRFLNERVSRGLWRRRFYG